MFQMPIIKSVLRFMMSNGKIKFMLIMVINILYDAYVFLVVNIDSFSRGREV